jgi:hypothetical protein
LINLVVSQLSQCMTYTALMPSPEALQRLAGGNGGNVYTP